MVDDDDDVIMISSDGTIIRIAVADISVYARPAKGVRVMRIDLESDTKLVRLARAPHEEEEDADGSDDAQEEPVAEDGGETASEENSAATEE